MATRRRTSPARSASRSTRRRSSAGGFTSRFTPEVVRSIVGTILMALGAITLIALILPGEGKLTDLWRDSIAPWFEAGRWLLPFLLLGGGWYVAAGPGKRPGSGWGMTLAGLALTYVASLGAFEVLRLDIFDAERGGGRIGRFLATTLEPLLTGPGTFVLLLAIMVTGLMLAFNLQLREVLRPVTGTARWVGSTTAESMRRAGEAATTVGATNGRAKPVVPPKPPVVAPVGVAEDPVAARSILDETPRSSQSPLSQTVWTGAADGGSTGVPTRLPNGGGVGAGRAAATAVVSEVPTALESLNAIDWTLPGIELLEPRPAGRVGTAVDHDANARRIEEKLLSFSIPAKVTRINSGPVVTQYEVRPEHHVKVSRIEALADDLAMALAARSIRIEAPIPGKDVVGIEIPNSTSEIVGFKPLVEESAMLGSTSPLTFALGRDVSGKAYAVDLAKMPHLLVAGATGSGKSVCVNALITSLLMRAHPDEVRMVLVDLKRVELAPYNGLPHLLQHVIVEPAEAKAVLNWAVREMEERYKLLAAHGVRNIAAFNARPDANGAGPDGDGDAGRMPYIVLIIDELADLIMREGRKVEDPIVKIAQKARAVGIHLVLATQRPSVNVVTGLIKANVPSRIAFAMASMVDSRTVLDQPGAEDLIGRGDMLYQPVDLPRPVRMQGVFVSDHEVNGITRHWLEQTGGRTFYDEGILAFADPEDGGNGDSGQFGWLRKWGVDEMTIPAAELVISLQRASTSMLQTKLKLGFARASRVMDELERYGIVGPQDPRNPATPRQIYGPENWLRSQDEVDDPGA
ncbi:MAG TPA: DNA translocase FtsK 4TM domain-containing protein [Candidatus Limnocylindrales bacterium]|nr:DNA translocase FtsK 4TM domain-containing protein [Candidatus Limnocylindrales bacterium]